MVSRTVERERRLAEARLLLPLAVTVGLVAERAPLVAVEAHGAVAVVAVDRAVRRVHQIERWFTPRR